METLSRGDGEPHGSDTETRKSQADGRQPRRASWAPTLWDESDDHTVGSDGGVKVYGCAVLTSCQPSETLQEIIMDQTILALVDTTVAVTAALETQESRLLAKLDADIRAILAAFYAGDFSRGGLTTP